MAIFQFYLLFSMLAVIYFDMTRFIIPNWLTASVLLLYLLAVYMSPAGIDWQMALMATLAVFIIGYGIFVLGWMGAGDIKLLIACAPWVGWGDNLVYFLMLVSILGGLLAVAIWGLRKLLPLVPREMKLPRILQNGQPIAYGPAIAVGFLMMMWGSRIPVLL